METHKGKADVSSAEAVFLGALAPGVNGPTWTTLKSAFVMLGLCLAVTFGLAFSSSDSSLILHAGFFLLIALILFFLLSWYSSYFRHTYSLFSTVYFFRYALLTTFLGGMFVIASSFF